MHVYAEESFIFECSGKTFRCGKQIRVGCRTDRHVWLTGCASGYSTQCEYVVSCYIASMGKENKCVGARSTRKRKKKNKEEEEEVEMP